MKRKLTAALLAALLLLTLVPSVFAGPDTTSAAGAYYEDGTMYAFAWFPEHTDPVYAPQAGLLVNNVQVGSNISAQKISDRGAGRFLLLIDNSSSMDVYRAQIRQLATSLFSAGETSVSVATLGVKYNLLAENLTKADDVTAIINRLSFSEQGTDICGGAIYAIDHMRGVWESGDLVNVIVVTDGMPFYANDAATEAASEAAAAEQLKTFLADSPQVYLHAVCLNEWEPATHEAVAAGGGLDLTVRSTADAKTAGSQIADWYASLYTMQFPLESYSDQLALRVEQGLIRVPRVGKAETKETDPGGFGDLPIVIDPEPSVLPSLPEETDGTEDTLPTEATEATEPTEATAETPAAEQTDTAAATEVTENLLPTEAPTVEKRGLLQMPVFWILIGVGALLLIGLTVLLILLLTRGKKKQPKAAAAPVPGAIPVTVQIRTGAQSGQQRQLWLKEHLMIGSDPRCDLALTDPSVSPLHTRIFRGEQGLLVEDLHSQTGTALGGMRLYAPNLLRSGDELLIGDVLVTVTF